MVSNFSSVSTDLAHADTIGAVSRARVLIGADLARSPMQNPSDILFDGVIGTDDLHDLPRPHLFKVVADLQKRKGDEGITKIKRLHGVACQWGWRFLPLPYHPVQSKPGANNGAGWCGLVWRLSREIGLWKSVCCVNNMNSFGVNKINR